MFSLNAWKEILKLKKFLAHKKEFTIDNYDVWWWQHAPLRAKKNIFFCYWTSYTHTTRVAANYVVHRASWWNGNRFCLFFGFAFSNWMRHEIFVDVFFLFLFFLLKFSRINENLHTWLRFTSYTKNKRWTKTVEMWWSGARHLFSLLRVDKM